jgi:hypothetical protein
LDELESILDGSGCGDPIEILSRHLPGRAEENNENILG